MTQFLIRVDSAPIIYSDFDSQFLQWIWVLVDSLNENLTDIESSIMSVSETSAALIDAEINTRYVVAENLLVTEITCPELAPVGSRITVAGLSSNGWLLKPFSGQTIKVGDVNMSAGTSIASTNQYDSIEIICVEANTTWITLSTQTMGFVIV